MSKHTWLIRAGHGGMFNGEYQTEGKRSPKWSDGSQVFEGEFNRDIAQRLMSLMTSQRIKYIQIHHPEDDIPLDQAIRSINTLTDTYDNCILLDIHANAGGGSGFEVWTSPGETKSDEYANVFADNFTDYFPEVNIRKDLSDGDSDKEGLFSVLTKTKCPALILESFFMDNEEECKKYLRSPFERQWIAGAYFAAIREIEING